MTMVEREKRARALQSSLFGLASLLSASLLTVPVSGDSGIQYPRVEAKVISAFRTADPERQVFGKMTFLGGLDLTSRSRQFAGISGLLISEDGTSLLAATDFGDWISADLVRNQNGMLAGVDRVRMARLGDETGKSLAASKAVSDAEAMTWSGGEIFVAFERQNRIYRYALDLAKLTGAAAGLPVPDGMTGLPGNKGIEGLASAPQNAPNAGMMVAIAERSLKNEKNIPAWILAGDNQGLFHIRRNDKFDITGADFDAAGRLYILERRFTVREGVAMRVRRISPDALQPDAIVDGEVLIFTDFTTQIDNMEGLSVRQGKNGKPVVSMISDNNRSPLQRTLLLEFEVND